MKYIDMLGIRNVPIKDIAKKMRYEKLDNVLKEASGREFMADLKVIQSNLAAVQLFNSLAKPQSHIKNPIGRALSNRIAQAIRDGKPYHVYMVLPVHPEGMLNSLNVMDQIYLTMQSLVFGEDSLVNSIRRSILAARWAKRDKTSFAAAMTQVKKLDPDKLEE
jgi:phospholipase D1/2